ncbi:hypothetical protein GTQ43_13530 [Nostoc sp. KVJ3]|uniref:sulfotransferase domain-containing protein n=1 Tax=Nostoc sp. KVJ3 TaxID=457945 RepID=UPI00223831FF|nr:sulfotransferase domain-containing protein [Nostoc sp. KVJ3]MCW5314788.1 hypothetical protein [Nostoc sp. KVJ3]
MSSLTLEEQQIALNGKLPNGITLDDVIFLVSYPKSGNTWVRFLIGNYLTEDKCDFTNYRQILPSIYDGRDLIENSKTRPLYITSHASYTPIYKKVIYVVRHGMDVAVSYYYFCLKFRTIPQKTKFHDFILLFNYGFTDHFNASIGTWSNHVHGWLDNASSNFLLISYEDLKNNPIQQLEKMLIFSGIKPNHEAVKTAVLASSFEKMQNLELKQYSDVPELINSDPSMNFVRKGQIGESQDCFNAEQMNSFIKFHGSALIRLGYLSENPKLLQQTQSQLQQTQSQLQQTQSQLQQTQSQLQQTQSQLQQTQSQLQQTQSQLQQTQSQLQQTQSQLQQTQSQLQQTEQRIAAMESSKFWKMRQAWFRIKQIVGLPIN